MAETALQRTPSLRTEACDKMLGMTLSSRFTLPGQVRAVAASDPSGPLTVTGYGANPLVTVITRVDLSGQVVWQRTYRGTGSPQSRLSVEGTLWIAYPDGDGRVLEGPWPRTLNTSMRLGPG
ncbi:hypothetical protein ADK75_25710 [Streptomyces virginiae]|uniref:Uncharacterized protein n=1 Tax=Streptomyces virginiae TaxID=1961 RepID=A0A0L8M8N8_STRVG|nr:hypothetical protein ADK75_25710 [Streptomyces virginiae]